MWHNQITLFSSVTLQPVTGRWANMFSWLKLERPDLLSDGRASGSDATSAACKVHEEGKSLLKGPNSNQTCSNRTEVRWLVASIEIEMQLFTKIV